MLTNIDPLTMNFGHYTYLLTTLIFAGGAVAIEYSLSRRTLWKFSRTVIAVATICTILGVFGEAVALKWGAWAYSPRKTLNVSVVGVPLETYLFSVLVSIAVSSATLYWANCEDRGIQILQHSLRRLKEMIMSKKS